MNEHEIHQKMIETQRFIANRAIHPETKLIYGKINLDDPDRWDNTVFPEPDSIKNRFCDDSEMPNVSNCAISGGRFLSVLVDCHDIAGLTECKKQAHTVFQGMKKLVLSPSFLRL